MSSHEPLEEAPEAPLLTIEEAARVLRIGRSLAYQLANEYLDTGGVAGMPDDPAHAGVPSGAAVGAPRARSHRAGRPALRRRGAVGSGRCQVTTRLHPTSIER